MKEVIKKILNSDERILFARLSTPAKIQDFMNTLVMRNDNNEPIVRSPRITIQNKEASCIEGALLACALLAYHGHDTTLLDLKVDAHNNKDSDHVVALFKTGKHFGAISKTSHAVLRYREPVYISVRELAMTYFHEYFLDNGTKTLRSFSQAFPLFKKYGYEWITSTHDLYDIAYALDIYPHTHILTPDMLKTLRKADAIEISAGKIRG